MRGLFVTGTDTGVGKTVVAAAIAAALARRGERVVATKPVITGLDEPSGGQPPPDHELLARVTGDRPEAVAHVRLGPATSPHLAAELAARPIDPAALVAAVRARAAPADGDAGPAIAIVEGAGGLLVPLTSRFLMRDLALALGLPVLVVARPSLGTINHSLLTVEAARAAGLRVAGVTMTPWPADPDALARSNRDTVARLAGLPVTTLAPLPRLDPEALAAAGRTLPIDAWLECGG